MAGCPTSIEAMSDSATVVTASTPLSPWMITVWVAEAAVTSSPGSNPTATTVPPIGATIVACATACSATSTCSSAALTAFWYATSSAALGDDAVSSCPPAADPPTA